jgi:hypothetical protein
MTDSVMDRVRQRLQDRLAEISEDLNRLEARNADRLEEWQQARQAAAEDGAEPAGPGDAARPSEEPEASEEEDESRIEAKRRTDALIEQLERTRPESMQDLEVRLRG